MTTTVIVYNPRSSYMFSVDMFSWAINIKHLRLEPGWAIVEDRYCSPYKKTLIKISEDHTPRYANSEEETAEWQLQYEQEQSMIV